MDALSEIHKDLGDLKQRRMIGLATYGALLAIFFAVLILQPAKATGLERDTPWLISFVLLLAGTLLGAVVTIGYPLVHRTAVYATTGLIAAGSAIALFMTVDPTAAGPEHAVRAGMHCFVYGTSMSAVAMLGLGIISGRVWRRFPDPSFVLALGMTGVGLAALHLRCGGVDPLHLFGFHLGPLLVVYALAHFAVRTRNRLSRDD